jgi:hypothetical protein
VENYQWLKSRALNREGRKGIRKGRKENLWNPWRVLASFAVIFCFVWRTMATLGLIEYKDASPEVRAVYDDIMSTRNTDWINNF